MIDAAEFKGTETASETKRYRLPGIEREGIAQLSLLETALWPLVGKLTSSVFETSYSYMTKSGPMRAEVKVRSTLGLQNFDEFVLWGLLGATLSRPNADAMLLATPYWMPKHLGLDTGGSQYVMLKESLVRLTTASYQNTGFYNPQSREREFAAFQFLSILLPTVGGVGGVVDNDRCWWIEWNPVFFRFCRASGGNLLFDLDLESWRWATQDAILGLHSRCSNGGIHATNTERMNQWTQSSHGLESYR